MIRRSRFPGAAASVADARRFTESVLSDQPPELVKTAVLMVSELATNAVKHAGAGFAVEISWTGHQVRVEVSDAGRGAPVLRSPTPADPYGRGLRIVELLAHSWGVATGGRSSKGVWFVLTSAASPQGPGPLRPQPH